MLVDLMWLMVRIIPELMLPDNIIHFIQFPGVSGGRDVDVSCVVWAIFDNVI